MVQGVHGAKNELNIALGVDGAERFPDDFAGVLDVHVVIDDDDNLGEHGLTERPDCVHYFACLAGVAFADGDDHQVLEDAFGGHGDVHNFRVLHFHYGHEDAFDGMAHEVVFLRRRADDGGQVERVFAMGDALYVEDGKLAFEGVKAGLVAEGAFGAHLADFDIAFEDDFGVGGDFEVNCFAGDQVNRVFAQEAGEHELVQIGRNGENACERGGGVGADGYSYFESAFGIFRAAAAVMIGAVFLSLPVHASGTGVVNLHAVAADVAFTVFRILGDDHGPGDVATAVLRPAFEDRESVERGVVGEHSSLAGSIADGFREEGADLGKLGEHLYLFEQALRGLQVEEGTDA